MVLVGIRELKNQLSRYLKLVKDGERILITERGRPIATLQPVVGEGLNLEERVAGLAASGKVRLGRGRLVDKPPKVKVSGRPVSQLILEDRR